MPVNAADTAWVLACTALVLFMTPGLALFYGGMVRSKHVLSMLAQNFAVIAVVSVAWALLGYTLAFSGTDDLLGNLHVAGLAHAGSALPGMHLTVPQPAFAGFQMMFAVIITALLTGAGASALALVLVLGKRRGWPREPMAPHSLPLTLLGAGILWFGWFGFNAGSALASGTLAAQALLGTHLAGCGGLLGWVLFEKRATGHATTLGAASGVVAGLVAITPAAGFV